MSFFVWTQLVWIIDVALYVCATGNFANCRCLWWNERYSDFKYLLQLSMDVCLHISQMPLENKDHGTKMFGEV